MSARRDGWLLALAVLAVSTAAVLIRGAAEAPPLVIATYRLVLGSLLFVVPAVLRRDRLEMRLEGRVLGVAVLAGVFLAGHFATWIASLRHTSVASSIALVTAHPLVVAIGSWLLFGERVTRRVAVGIGIGLLGIVALALVDHGGETAALPAGANALVGDALAFAGCLFIAGYFFCGRWVRGRVSLLAYVATAYGTAALLLVVTSLATGQRLAGFSPATYLFFALLAIVPQGLGHTLVNRSLRAFPAPIVSLAILGEVPLSTAMAWALLGEAVPPARLGAVAVIVVAVAVAVAEPSRARRASPAIG